MRVVRKGQSNQRNWVTEGLMLAGSSLAGSLLVYIYEAAYCAAFSIPAEFIALTPTTVFLGAYGVLIYCFVFYALPALPFLLLRAENRNERQLLIRTWLAMVLPLALLNLAH